MKNLYNSNTKATEAAMARETTQVTTTTLLDTITKPTKVYTTWGGEDLWKQYDLAGLNIFVGSMSYKDKDLADFYGRVEVYNLNSWQKEFLQKHGWEFNKDKIGEYAHATAWDTQKEWEEAQDMVLKAIFGQPLEWQSNNKEFVVTEPLKIRRENNCAVFVNENGKAVWKTSPITNITKDEIHGVILITTEHSDYQGSLPLHIRRVTEDNQVTSGRGGKCYKHILLSRPASLLEIAVLLKKEGYDLKEAQGWWDDGATITGSGLKWTYCWNVAYTD